MTRSPLRILHTNMLRGWGGQSNRILTEALTVSRLSQQEDNPPCEIALALPRGSELGKRALNAGLTVFDDFTFRGPGRLLSFARDIRRFRALLRAKPWDILHLHGSPDTWVAVFALQGLRQKPAAIRTRHNNFPIAKHPLNAWLYGRHIDGLIVISNAIQKQCQAIPFLADKSYALIWSVPDLTRFGHADPESRARIRRELNVNPETPVVACVGRLRPEKGQDFLIQTAPALFERLPEAQIWIVGDGSHRETYQQLATELGVEDRVRFLGFRKDTPEIFVAADVAVCPSRSEGLGTAALEALASGTPVVATNVGGLPDSVKPGETGTLVTWNDTTALREALETLLRDKPLQKRLGQAGQTLVRQRFTEAALARRTLDFYRQSVVSQKGVKNT